jgi:hypothetical protein
MQDGADIELTVDDMAGCNITGGNVVVTTTVPAVKTEGSVSCCGTGVLLISVGDANESVEGVTIFKFVMVDVVVHVDKAVATVWTSDTAGRRNRFPEGSCERLVGVVAVAGGD